MREYETIDIPELVSSETGALHGNGGELFDEAREMELASQLLDVSEPRELDQFLGNLIKRAGRSVGSFLRSDAGRAIGGLLKGAAKKALPFLDRNISGGLVDAGDEPTSTAGPVFGLELEGLSPEDQEFELARRFVRFGGSAVQNATSLARNGVSGQAAARQGVLRAARRFAPGLLRRRNHFRRRLSIPGGFLPQGGRWFRHGANIVIVNCKPPTNGEPPSMGNGKQSAAMTGGADDGDTPTAADSK